MFTLPCISQAYCEGGTCSVFWTLQRKHALDSKVSCSGIAPGSGKDCLCTWTLIQWRTLTWAFAWLRIAAVFFHMSLSWMCSNKIILKQAVDIQWFINTFRWVLRPLIFYQECTPSHFLERSVEDRCNGYTYVWPGGGTTAIAITMQIMSTTVDFVFWLPSSRICFPGQRWSYEVMSVVGEGGGGKAGPGG